MIDIMNRIANIDRFETIIVILLCMAVLVFLIGGELYFMFREWLRELHKPSKLLPKDRR